MTGYCPNCYTGKLTIENRLFLLQSGRGVMVAPQTLALACDQCDFLQFDPVTIQQIGALLESPVLTRKQLQGGELKPRLPLPAVRESSHEIQ